MGGRYKKEKEITNPFLKRSLRMAPVGEKERTPERKIEYRLAKEPQMTVAEHPSDKWWG